MCPARYRSAMNGLKTYRVPPYAAAADPTPNLVRTIRYTPTLRGR